MNLPSRAQVCCWCVSGLVLLAAGRASAQPLPEVEPRWLRLQFPESSVGVDVEGLREDQTSDGGTSTHEYIQAVPLFGLRAAGSVYHPDLMTFDFNGQGGVGWAEDKVTGTGYSQTRNESQDLLRYVATVNFLAAKPYNASFFASQDHDYNNYDFFNTATVDSTRYGGRVAWNAEHFNLSADAGYRDQTASGLTTTTETEETYLNFNGLNRRPRGSSTLTYSYDDFGDRVNDSPTQNNVSQAIGGSDTETFGAHNQISATTGASYGWAQYPGQSTETFNVNENVVAQLNHDLESHLALSYYDNDLEPTTSTLFQGLAGVRHQLYESLTSSLDVHGTYGEVSDPDTSSVNDRYGVGLSENYAKRLGPWGRLTLGGGVVVDHESYDTFGGGTLTTINEPHTLKDGALTLLNNPQVIASTVFVTGPNGVPVYVNGADYLVIPHGQLTEIQRIPTSILLLNNSSVLISYQSQAPSTASFNEVNGSAQIRVDLFNLVGLYGRLNVVDNNAPPEALAETLTDWVGGADVTWRWLRAGAEYEDFDSNFTQYRAERLFENFTFQLDGASSLGLNFNQIWYSYPGDQKQTQYQNMALFNTQVSSWLQWSVEGGYYRQEALGVQQDLAAARTALNFVWGKLSARLGYQYNYMLTQQTETRDRNFFYVYLKRAF